MVFVKKMINEVSIYVLYSVPNSAPVDFIPNKEDPHYIGSTKNCSSRLRKHLSDFNNKEMRRSECSSNNVINGAEFMCLEVLEKCAEIDRYTREKHWLNHFKNNGYNVVNKNNPNRTREEYNEYMKLYMRRRQLR